MSFLIRRALRKKHSLLRGTPSLLAGWTAISLLALLLAGGFSLIPQPVQAQEFNKGVAAYKAGKYREAVQQFNIALSKRPSASINYWLAASYHQLKDYAHAKSYYLEAINYDGLGPVGKNAIKGLQAIDPATAKSIYSQLSGQPLTASTRTVPSSSQSGTTRVVSSTSSAPASQAGELIAPQESRIPVTKQPNGAAVVQAQLNGRSIEMLYDTGATECAFGKNHLSELGIKPPTGPHMGYAAGIGDGGNQKIWVMRANLRVGQIERRNFPITVQENLPTEPLLGQSFFRDFKYEIDNQASAIRLVRTDSAALAATKRSSIYAGATSNSTRDVPFRREGNELVVDVMVNGRPLPMIFDTGADGIVFGSQHLQTVGLRVPDDAEEGINQGIAGSTKVKKFSVQRMQLGPIIKQDVPISAVEGHSSLPHPLLGQTFFGNWKFAIDNANSVIKFHSASGD